uniref:Sulfotransferase n=1 Tax=Ciona intestinalis TaxID=7719 RepID=F6UBW4_CIOIN
MKIIVAGFAKTGTKSLTAALTELGYVVYDYLENFSYLGDDWQRILTKGGTTDDFRRMYDNVDVTIDSPVYFYWEEIHRAFPDAKIILSIRDEDSWLNSLKKQSDEISNNTVLHFMQTLSPTGRKFFKFSQTWVMAVFGIFMKSPFHDIPFNDMLHRITYRQHNKYVLGTAPKDKLLVYKK